MHDSIKDSELVPVEKAGHGFYYEEKEKVNAELMRFIGQISLFAGPGINFNPVISTMVNMLENKMQGE